MRIVYHHRTRSTDAQRIHILEMVRAFEELGHDVEIVSLVHTDTAQDDPVRNAGTARWQRFVRSIPFGYELIQLAYNVVGFWLLIRRLFHKKTDFIYERYSLFNFAGVLAARCFRVPLVLEVNAPFAVEQFRDHEIRATGIARWSERVICNLADHVIVVSTPLKTIMESFHVTGSKIVVMSNGVSLEQFRTGVPSQELKTELGLTGSPVFGFVGWFRKWHGLEMLVDAFHDSGLAAAGAQVLLIGDGPAMDGLRDLVRKRNLERQVRFSGPVRHIEVPRYLDLVDIAVQPAANEYCCPMKVLEYMALAKPVIAPRQDNITDLVSEGENAILFTPNSTAALADALRQLARDGDRVVRMGSRARAAITERGYLWTENARRVVEMVLSRTGEQPAKAHNISAGAV